MAARASASARNAPFPESRAYVEKLFADTLPEITRKVVGETAARIFGLEHMLPGGSVAQAVPGRA